MNNMDIYKVKKLKIQQDLLEKHITTMLNGLNLASDHNKLQIVDQELKDQKLKMKLASDGDVITDKDSTSQEIEQFKITRTDYEKSISCQDVLNNEIMSTDENDVRNNLEKLSDIEKTLSQKLEILQNHIGNYKLNTEKMPSTMGITSIRNKSSVQCDKANPSGSKVEEFQTFLKSSGGHTGGWEDHDHQLFCKYRMKLKGVRMADALHIMLPDISPEAIADHEKWYQQYEILKAQQKEAIKAWKEANHKESIVVDLPSEEQSVKKKVDPEVAKEMAEKKKQKIMEWKLKKQEQKLIEKREKTKEFEKKSLEKKIKAQELAQQKKIIEEYKQRKACVIKEANLMQNTKKENKDHLISNKKLLAMFQERDRTHTEKILQRLESSKQTTVEYSHKVEAERDPERLLNPTKAWTHRVEQQKKQDATGVLGDVNYIRHLPHLKVPTWRKNL